MNTDYLVKILWLPILMIVYLFSLNSLFSRPDLDLPLRSYVVQSGSMEPTIMTGDVVLVSTRPYEVKTGDIITYLDPKGITVTHRIKSIIDASGTPQIFTKGDNNQSADSYVITADKIIGKYVLRVPKLGLLLVHFSQPLVNGSMIIAILALIFIPDLLKEKPAINKS